MKLLTIAICSLPERHEFLGRLYSVLTPQIIGKPVELLVLTDNRSMSIGAKRNNLVDMASGKYITHIDDDDMVASNYVDVLLSKITEADYDCITFTCMVSWNGGAPVPCFYSKHFEYSNLPHLYLRKPNHICCYKKSIAWRNIFLDVEYGEDDEWAQRASKDINLECRLGNVLYHYQYQEKPMEWFRKVG